MKRRIPLGVKYLVGVDEVGRGPLAGPVAVCTCAVPIDFDFASLPPLTDSKKMSPLARERVEQAVRDRRAGQHIQSMVCMVSEKWIDKKGLAWVLKKALHDALKRLAVKPEECLVLLDGGLRAPKEYIYQITIVKGDAKEKVIGLASVLAKVKRDKYMKQLAKKLPAYGFDRHKGYGTKAHYAAIKKHGVSKVHRKSFLKKL